MPQLLFISLHNFVQLLFERGYYSRVAFIKLRTEDKESLHAKFDAPKCRLKVVTLSCAEV